MEWEEELGRRAAAFELGINLAPNLVFPTFAGASEPGCPREVE